MGLTAYIIADTRFEEKNTRPRVEIKGLNLIFLITSFKDINIFAALLKK